MLVVRYMLEGESKFVVYKTKSRGKTYDKCLINIPSKLVKDPQFPFKTGDDLKILIDPDGKTMFLLPPWLSKEVAIEVAKETARQYEKGLKDIDSDPTLTPFQKKVAKLYYETTFKEGFPRFLSDIAKKAFEDAKTHAPK